MPAAYAGCDKYHYFNGLYDTTLWRVLQLCSGPGRSRAMNVLLHCRAFAHLVAAAWAVYRLGRGVFRPKGVKE